MQFRFGEFASRHLKWQNWRTMLRSASPHDQLLVAILNDVSDFELARDEHWYRIPCDKAEKWLGDRWPPRWLAFYQTKHFGAESHTVTWYAAVQGIRRAQRRELLPHEARNYKSQRWYFKLSLGPLQRCAQPILSRRYRRIVFIKTTWDKFTRAAEINDLFDDSPLEDRLWAQFKKLKISVERQEFVKLDADEAALDFAIYCCSGKIDVETDGDTWHANPQRAGHDNLRDNALVGKGWSILRFNTAQIVEQMEDYCLPQIVDQIKKFGGIDENGNAPRRIELPNQLGLFQKGLFDGP
jgi:very-short-patch-repair endonuclease